METSRRLTTVAAIVAIVCLSQVLPALSQNLPLCRVLRSQFRNDKVRLFRNAEGVPNIVDHLCVNNRRAVRRFYSCREDFTSFLPTVHSANPESINDFNKIYDVRSLSQETGLPSNAVLFCKAPEPTPTEAPEPEETEAPVVVLPSCPSGPARTSEYLRQEQEKLCEMRCEVRTSVNGIPTGSRPRTIYRCCKGEPRIKSRALGLYECPDTPAN